VSRVDASDTSPFGNSVARRWAPPGPRSRPRPAPPGSVAAAALRFSAGLGRLPQIRRQLAGPAPIRAVGNAGQVAPPRWWLPAPARSDDGWGVHPAPTTARPAGGADGRLLRRAVGAVPTLENHRPGAAAVAMTGRAIPVRRSPEVAFSGNMKGAASKLVPPRQGAGDPTGGGPGGGRSKAAGPPGPTSGGGGSHRPATGAVPRSDPLRFAAASALRAHSAQRSSRATAPAHPAASPGTPHSRTAVRPAVRSRWTGAGPASAAAPPSGTAASGTKAGRNVAPAPTSGAVGVVRRAWSRPASPPVPSGSSAAPPSAATGTPGRDRSIPVTPSAIPAAAGHPPAGRTAASTPAVATDVAPRSDPSAPTSAVPPPVAPEAAPPSPAVRHPAISPPAEAPSVQRSALPTAISPPAEAPSVQRPASPSGVAASSASAGSPAGPSTTASGGEFGTAGVLPGVGVRPPTAGVPTPPASAASAEPPRGGEASTLDDPSVTVSPFAGAPLIAHRSTGAPIEFSAPMTAPSQSVHDAQSRSAVSSEPAVIPESAAPQSASGAAQRRLGADPVRRLPLSVDVEYGRLPLAIDGLPGPRRGRTAAFRGSRRLAGLRAASLSPQSIRAHGLAQLPIAPTIVRAGSSSAVTPGAPAGSPTARSVGSQPVQPATVSRQTGPASTVRPAATSTISTAAAAAQLPKASAVAANSATSSAGPTPTHQVSARTIGATVPPPATTGAPLPPLATTAAPFPPPATTGPSAVAAPAPTAPSPAGVPAGASTPPAPPIDRNLAAGSHQHDTAAVSPSPPGPTVTAAARTPTATPASVTAAAAVTPAVSPSTAGLPTTASSETIAGSPPIDDPPARPSSWTAASIPVATETLAARASVTPSAVTPSAVTPSAVTPSPGSASPGSAQPAAPAEHGDGEPAVAAATPHSLLVSRSLARDSPAAGLPVAASPISRADGPQDIVPVRAASSATVGWRGPVVFRAFTSSAREAVRRRAMGSDPVGMPIGATLFGHGDAASRPAVHEQSAGRPAAIGRATTRAAGQPTPGSNHALPDISRPAAAVGRRAQDFGSAVPAVLGLPAAASNHPTPAVIHPGQIAGALRRSGQRVPAAVASASGHASRPFGQDAPWGLPHERHQVLGAADSPTSVIPASLGIIGGSATRGVAAVSPGLSPRNPLSRSHLSPRPASLDGRWSHRLGSRRLAAGIAMGHEADVLDSPYSLPTSGISAEPLLRRSSALSIGRSVSAPASAPVRDQVGARPSGDPGVRRLHASAVTAARAAMTLGLRARPATRPSVVGAISSDNSGNTGRTAGSPANGLVSGHPAHSASAQNSPHLHTSLSVQESPHLHLSLTAQNSPHLHRSLTAQNSAGGRNPAGPAGSASAPIPGPRTPSSRSSARSSALHLRQVISPATTVVPTTTAVIRRSPAAPPMGTPRGRAEPPLPLTGLRAGSTPPGDRSTAHHPRPAVSGPGTGSNSGTTIHRAFDVPSVSSLFDRARAWFSGTDETDVHDQATGTDTPSQGTAASPAPQTHAADTVDRPHSLGELLRARSSMTEINDRTPEQPVSDALSPREWDQLVDLVVERIEDRVRDELARRGRRFSPGVF